MKMTLWAVVIITVGFVVLSNVDITGNVVQEVPLGRPLIDCGEKITDTRFPDKIILTGLDPVTQKECGKGYGIIVQKNHMTLDCNNNKIRGSKERWSGILIKSRAKVTVKNCDIDGFNSAIEVIHSSKNIIEDNILRGNKAGMIMKGTSRENILRKNFFDLKSPAIIWNANGVGNLIYANDFFTTETIDIGTSVLPKVCFPNNEEGAGNYLTPVTLDGGNLQINSICGIDSRPHTKEGLAMFQG